MGIFPFWGMSSLPNWWRCLALQRCRTARRLLHKLVPSRVTGGPISPGVTSPSVLVGEPSNDFNLARPKPVRAPAVDGGESEIDNWGSWNANFGLKAPGRMWFLMEHGPAQCCLRLFRDWLYSRLLLHSVKNAQDARTRTE